jgi:hypothetical protein
VASKTDANTLQIVKRLNSTKLKSEVENQLQVTPTKKGKVKIGYKGEGYNTSTVALRVVRGDVKGTQCPGV